MLEPFENIVITIGEGVTNNRAVINGAVIINAGGVNNAPVVGTVTINSGGTNSGNVTGNLYITSSTAVNTATAVTGNIILAEGVTNALSNLVRYSGSVVQVVSGSLNATTYTGGTAGSPVTAPNGTYYNLEGDNKARTYTSGTGEDFTGNAYNLTGDLRAYSWANGVQGALFTGTIGAASYTDGVLNVVGSSMFVVSGDTNAGHLFTATGGSVTAGPVYTSSSLTTFYTGVFAYSGTDYYAAAGTPNTYRSWTVTNDSNSGTLYTAPTGDVTSTAVYTDTARSTTYAGVFTYSGTDYYATTGTPVAYLTYTVTGDTNTVNSGFLYSLVGFGGGPTEYLYTEPALVNKYTGYYMFDGGSYYALDGVANTYRAWTINGNNAVTVTYTAPDALDITSGDYLVYSDTALQTQYNDFYVYDSLTYLPSGGVPALLTGNNFGPNGSMFDYGANGTDNPTALSNGTYQLVNEGLWYNLDFNGAGTLATAGVYADATGYYRSFVGDGTATEATGTYEDNGVFYTYSGDGARATVTDGISAAANGTWYTFANNGIGTLFDGAYYDSTDGYYWPVVSGVVTKTEGYASGRLKQTNGYYYTFDGTGTAGAAFEGAYFDGTSYYSISGGGLQIQNYASGRALLFNDGLYYTFDNTGDAGVLFEGAVYDPVDSYYWPMVNGAITKSTYAGTYVGTILQLLDDGKYYFFYQNGGIGDAFSGVVTNYQGLYQDVSDGSLGSLFNGAYSLNNIAFTVESGATTGNPAIGILRDIYNVYRQFSLGTPWNGSPLCDGVLVYEDNYTKFSNGYYIGLFTGAHFASNTYYHINAGSLTNDYAPAGILQLSTNLAYYTFTGDGTTAVNFDGVYFDGTSYYFVNDGTVTNYYTSAVAQLVNNQKFYKFDGTGGAGVLFDGAASFLGHYFPVNAGVLDNSGHANGLLQLADDELYYTFFSADGTKSAEPFTGVVGIGDYHYEVAVGVREVTASFTGVYLRATDGLYLDVLNGANAPTGPNGMYRFAGDNKYHYFPGDNTLGALFNGAVNIGGSYYSVIAGVREATATFNGATAAAGYYTFVTNGTVAGGYAQGVLIFDSDGLYYNFTGNGVISTAPATGIVNVGGSYYYVTEGVRETTATVNAVYYNVNYGATGAYFNISSGELTGNAASGVGLLVNDMKYYIFGNAVVLFTGAYFDGTNYRPVDSGVRSTAPYTYASGFLQLDSDQKYYSFSGDGNAGTLFDGAYHDGTYYRPVSAGEVNYSAYANGVMILLNDAKIYLFNGDGTSAGLFTGALSDGTHYRPVSAGEVNYSSYAGGIQLLASDQKYYTFYGDGNAGALFDGAYLLGEQYYQVVAGVLGISTAIGVYQLANDAKYYTFSYSEPVLLAHGGASYNGKWYNVLNGERQSSYFTYGVVGASSGPYYTVNSNTGAVSDSQAQQGGMYMLYDGTWHTFFNAIPATAVTPSNYTTSCDQTAGSGDELFLAVQGTNLGDRVVQIGTVSNSARTHTIPQVPSNTFVVSGFKYDVDTNGVIDDIYTCSNHYAD